MNSTSRQRETLSNRDSLRLEPHRAMRPIRTARPMTTYWSPVVSSTFVQALATCIAVVVITTPATAHHGTASFDTTKEVMLKGTVTEWIWANPHCFLKFDAKDDTGAVRNWAVEVANPTDMTKRGWARGS